MCINRNAEGGRIQAELGINVMKNLCLLHVSLQVVVYQRVTGQLHGSVAHPAEVY